MLKIELSTVDPGIVFLMVWHIRIDEQDELLFANEIPYIKVSAIIDKYANEYVLE